MSSVLLVDDRGPVRILTMNRPEKRNALNSELTSGLLQALRDADASDAVGAIVLTGAGQGFCAGADLSEFKGAQDVFLYLRDEEEKVKERIRAA